MNNEDLIYVTANCPTEEQEKKLEECINSLEKIGYDIALVSHTHIPLNIQKKCKYYIYDHFNDISEDENLLSDINFYIPKGIIVSKYFQKYFYGFAIFRMINLACNLAINFGYKKLHYIEYDCVVNNGSFIKENSKLLETYDSILYTTNGNKNDGLIGGIHSCLTNKIPELFKKYDRENIENLLKENQNNCVEDITKLSFLNSGNVLFKNGNELTEDIITIGYKFKNRNVHYTLYYDNESEKINIIYNNVSQSDQKIMLIVNNNKVINFISKINFWNIEMVGNINGIRNVKVFIDDRISYEKNFNDENIQTFKNNSYIIKK